MKSRLVVAIAVLCLVAVSQVVVSAAPKEPKDAKCPVSGKACNPEASADFAARLSTR